jgi:predicted nuclease with TOPRIM domain
VSVGATDLHQLDRLFRSSALMDVRDELAALRAEKAALLHQLTERDSQLAATRRRADKAETELVTLKILQSATLTMRRSREMRPGEKVLGVDRR